MAKTTIDDMTLEQLEKNAARVEALLLEIEGLLPGLEHFTSDDRTHSEGRFRNEGEESALRAVLATIEHDPASFRVLAAKDNGRDPKRVETDLLLARLNRRAVLVRIASKLVPLAQKCEDTVLAQGELCKPVLSAAYQIARPLADHDAEIRTALQPAIDYYGAIGRKAAATRAANKADKPNP
ncbi:MAG: hypothetical protein U0326_24555 [Polyangiales bacterium]